MNERFSTAFAAFCTKTPLENAMKVVKDAGFDSLDFSFHVYSSGPEAPMNRDDWRSWVQSVADIARRVGLPITQAHATWNQPIAEDLHFEAPWEIYERSIEACHMLGCRHLIFHPMRQSGRVDSPALRERIHDWNVRWFCSLIPALERWGVQAELENTFDSHHVQKPGDPPFPYTRAEDLLRLLRDIGSSFFGLCLDTGHANICGQDIPAMIRLYGRELSTLHLNDNYGFIQPMYEDLHLFPGYGEIDWAPIFAALRQVGYRGVYNIEPIVTLDRMPDGIRTVHLRAAAQTLRELMK